MGKISKQVSIYISLISCVSAYTMIASFYPEIASSKGVPSWLIGAIFSADPLFGLITSLVLGKFMIQVGRKAVILFSVFCIGLSIIFLAPIEHLDKGLLIVASFLSRIFAGIGAGCIFTSSNSVLVSDYPEETQKMVSRIQVSIGLGLILGPLIGILVNIGNLMYSLIAFSILTFAFIPLSSKLLGKFRVYNIQNTTMDPKTLLFKTVIHK